MIPGELCVMGKGLNFMLHFFLSIQPTIWYFPNVFRSFVFTRYFVGTSTPIIWQVQCSLFTAVKSGFSTWMTWSAKIQIVLSSFYFFALLGRTFLLLLLILFVSTLPFSKLFFSFNFSPTIRFSCSWSYSCSCSCLLLLLLFYSLLVFPPPLACGFLLKSELQQVSSCLLESWLLLLLLLLLLLALLSSSINCSLLARVWVTASLLRSPGLLLVFWSILTML